MLNDDIWYGYTPEELQELDDEWEEFYDEMENNDWQYDTGWE